MNIASAFLMGTKIKEVEVPANPWTKIGHYPNETSEYLLKNGASYNGNIYMFAGNPVSKQASVTTRPVVHVYNGSSWSDTTLPTLPDYGYAWTYTEGDTICVTYQGKLYAFNGKIGDYGYGGPMIGYVYDGNEWKRKLTDGGAEQGGSAQHFPIVNQAVVKDGLLYLFKLNKRGSWNVSYWWSVYTYDATTDNLLRLVDDYAEDICDGMISGSQSGAPKIVVLDGKFHVVDGSFHAVLNDDWSYTQLNNISPAVDSAIVYKGKIHAFGPGGGWSPYSGNHLVWDSVNDTWENSDDSPYPNSYISYSGYSNTRPIIHKNKLTLLTAYQQLGYASEFDDIYKYNR